MDFKEIVFLTMSSIKERRTRTILTITMITMGCGLLVSLNSLTQGLIDFVEQNFKNILPNQIIISNSDKIQQSNLQNIQNKLEVLFDKNLTVVDKRIPFDNNAVRYLQNLSGVNFVDPAYQGMILLKNKDKSEITNVIAIINSTGNPIIDNSVFIETKVGKEILNKSNDYDILFLTYNDINKVDDIVKSVQKHFNNQVSILNSLEIIKTLTKFIVGIT